jgi:hypothetical protein
MLHLLVFVLLKFKYYCVANHVHGAMIAHAPRNLAGIGCHVMDPPLEVDPAFLACRAIVGIREIDFYMLGTSCRQAQVIVVLGCSAFDHSAFVWNLDSITDYIEYVTFDTFQRRVPLKYPKIVGGEVFNAEP